MKSAYCLLTALTCALLMGCGSSADMRDKLGLNREGPDEYRVVPRPPLSIPPEFNLRPPTQGSQYVSGMPAQARAQQQVLGAGGATPTPASSAFANTAITPITSSGLPTTSDAQFLSNAGTTKADPKIRQELLDEKNAGVSTQDPNYFFGGKSSTDPLVDPTKEADRIKLDKEQNKPVTTGETPVIVPEDKGLLGNIF